MKRFTVIFALVIGNVTAEAQADFYTNVTNLWSEGYKLNVLAIANARLAVMGIGILFVVAATAEVLPLARAAYGNALIFE